MPLTRTLAFAILAAAAAPAFAESFASSASVGSSASIGSVSDSLGGSSNASSPNRTAAGDYRVIDVAAVAGKPGVLRLTLAPVAAAAETAPLRLDLPQALVQQHALAAGSVVGARERPYGLEFAKGEPREPFFLVLDDAWYRELHSRAL